jgi:hypothetical protein
MNQERGSVLRAKWKQIADSTDDNWDWNFWNVMAERTPLPNEDARYQSHLILTKLSQSVRMLVDSMERSGINLSQWSTEVADIKKELDKRDALSDMFSADWNS